jgi:hypothetical protein
MKIGASLVLLVAPTVIACAAAVPVGAGRAYKSAHTTNPNGVFRKRASPLRSNARNLRISGCASNFEGAREPLQVAHVLLALRLIVHRGRDQNINCEPAAKVRA